MEHFSDPVLSQIQSSVESELRRKAAETGEEVSGKDFSRNQHMQNVYKVCRELNSNRKNPLKKFRHYGKIRHLDKEDPECVCMEYYAALFLCRLYGDSKKYDKLENEFKFSTCDPEWVKAIEKYFSHYGLDGHHNVIPYVSWSSLSDYVHSDLPNNLKISILGDWGTGQEIARNVLELSMKQEPDLIIHLGDVYYAGTQSEYEHKFLNLINTTAINKSGNPVPVLNLPGNHDMYSGGKPFYDSLKALNQRQENSPDWDIQQEASFFCLRLENKSWQIIGIDTSYHDHDPFTVETGITRLREREEDWLVDKIQNFPGKTLLLSHHQPFSPFEQIGSMVRKKPSDFYKNPYLMKMLQRIRRETGKDLDVWIWGHEHNLAIYKPYSDIQCGRCVGHSAIPVLSTNNPYETRVFKPINFFQSLVALLKGKWGLYLHRETAAFIRLMLKPGSVVKPELETTDDQPVKLSLSRDGDLYRNGYSMLNFTDNGNTSDLRIDYYDDVEYSPLYSENISG